MKKRPKPKAKSKGPPAPERAPAADRAPPPSGPPARDKASPAQSASSPNKASPPKAPSTPVKAPAPDSPAPPSWRARLVPALVPYWPWAALVTASVLYRLPSLINAEGTNSDAAVVGLQAWQILRGEWSPFLWGSGYQTSVDSIVAAVAYMFTGPSGLALMMTALLGHIALTLLVYDVLRARIGVYKALLLASLLIFTGGPVHTYVLYPPRQASLTIAFVALWVLDKAPSRKNVMLHMGLGGALASFAVYADPYTLLFLPIAGALGILGCLDGFEVAQKGREKWQELWRTMGALVVGGALGMVPYRLLMRHPLASKGETSLTLDAIPRTWEILKDSGLPWLLGTKVYAARVMSDYAPVGTGPLLHGFQVMAAVMFMAMVVCGLGLFFARSSRIPWETRRLGLAGALGVPVTLGGFLLSPMVMDHFSSRYLAAIVLCAPFALAPLAHLLDLRKITLLAAPFLISSALSGWVSYRPFGLSRHPSIAEDEQLGVLLRERGIHYASAGYWASYRLTHLYREDPIVVPENAAQDRYKPYRDRFDAARTVAYIHDPYRAGGSVEAFEGQIKAGKTMFEPVYDKFETGRFTVLVLTRRYAVRTAHAGASTSFARAE